MNRDDRIPSSLQNKPGSNYDQNEFEGSMVNERPTRDKPRAATSKNSNISTGKPDSNFQSRKKIDIDENDDTITNPS